MKPRLFFKNISAVSVMYDAIFFLVMVSLSGVLLLPALHSTIAREGSLDLHREEVVDDTLQTYLTTRVDFFNYTFAGTLLDDVAGTLGIKNTSDGLYRSITSWVLGHEQLHKTYSSLLAENLACQFVLPFSLLGSQRLNVFTEAYDNELHNETAHFFSQVFHEKYHYNFTAVWRPLKGVPFGGCFFSGEHPPTKDCYVARRLLMMPYSPVITLGNHTFIFTKHWLKQQLFGNTSLGMNSSIPSISNITHILNCYSKEIFPYDTHENATQGLTQNLSRLLSGFLLEGIINESNKTVFPGIVPLMFEYGFGKLRNFSSDLLNDVFNTSFGEAVRYIDRLFFTLNSSKDNPFSEMILSVLNETIQTSLNDTCGSLEEAFDACEKMVTQKIRELIKQFSDPYIESCATYLLQCVDLLMDSADFLIDWLCDRISINTAEATLTIWVVRE